MLKFILLPLLTFLLIACGNGFGRHHIMLNDKDGINTEFSPKNRQLRLSSNEAFVLYFFDTDCGACKAQIPDINSLNEQYGAKIKFIGVLGGSRGFDKDIELLKDEGVGFMTTSDPLSVEYFSTAVGGINGVPATFIFDKDGNLVGRFLGLTPKKAIEKKLSLAL